MKDNYKYFMKTDMSNYVGEWVAVCREKIVSHGKDFNQVFKEARKKFPNDRPLVSKIPDKGGHI